MQREVKSKLEVKSVCLQVMFSAKNKAVCETQGGCMNYALFLNRLASALMETSVLYPWTSIPYQSSQSSHHPIIYNPHPHPHPHPHTHTHAHAQPPYPNPIVKSSPTPHPPSPLSPALCSSSPPSRLNRPDPALPTAAPPLPKNPLRLNDPLLASASLSLFPPLLTVLEYSGGGSVGRSATIVV